MNLWIATRADGSSKNPLAAPSDLELRSKILAEDPDGTTDWDIVFGETKTDKARVLELIEGKDPVQQVKERAVYHVEEGKVKKRREATKRPIVRV